MTFSLQQHIVLNENNEHTLSEFWAKACEMTLLIQYN